MRDDHRFASLGGAGRRWLMEDDLEVEVEVKPARDAGAPAQAGLEAEAEHDGWKPIVPRQRPLAYLGDLVRL